MSTTTTETTTVCGPSIAGMRVVTWGRNGSQCANFKRGGHSFSVPTWIAKEYVAVARKSDGVVTWRLAGTIGSSMSGNSCPTRIVREATEYAARTGMPVVHVQHGYRAE
jgi:hypothetical protein